MNTGTKMEDDPMQKVQSSQIKSLSLIIDTLKGELQSVHQKYDNLHQKHEQSVVTLNAQNRKYIESQQQLRTLQTAQKRESKKEVEMQQLRPSTTSVFNFQSPDQHRVRIELNNDGDSNIGHFIVESTKNEEPDIDMISQNEQHSLHQILCHFYKLMICAVDKEIESDFDLNALRTMGLDEVYNDLCSEIISRKKKSHKMESNLKDVMLKNEGLKVENGKMREMLVRCRRDMAAYREQQGDKEKEYDALSEQYRCHQLESNQKINALTNELENERNQIMEKETEIESLKSEIVDLNANRIKLEDAKEILKETMASQCTEWDTLTKAMKTKFTKNQRSLMSENRKLQKEKEILIEQQYALKKDVQSIQHQNTKKEEQIRSFVNDAKHFKAERKELIESKTQCQYQLESTIEELSDLTLKFKESEDQRVQTIQELKELKVVHDQSESTVQRLENEVQSLSSTSERNEKIQDELQQKLEALQHGMHQKEEQIESLQTENRGLVMNGNRMKQELVLLANEHQFVVDNLEFERDRNGSLKEDADHYRLKMNEMMESKTKIQYESESISEENASLKLQFGEKEMVINQLNEELDALKQMKIGNESEIKRLQKEATNLKVHCQQLQESQIQIAEKWNVVQYQLKEKEETVDAVKDQKRKLKEEMNGMMKKMELLRNQYRFSLDNLEFEKKRGDDLQEQIQTSRGELEGVFLKAQQEQRKYLAEMKDAENKSKIQERKYRHIMREYKELKRDVAKLKVIRAKS